VLVASVVSAVPVPAPPVSAPDPVLEPPVSRRSSACLVAAEAAWTLAELPAGVL